MAVRPEVCTLVRQAWIFARTSVAVASVAFGLAAKEIVSLLFLSRELRLACLNGVVF